MDKKTNLHEAGTFEDLLLDMILENKKPEPEIQKSIDMTANTLFSNTATIALPAISKQNFLSQYPQFTSSWWTRMNIFRLFVGTVATLAVLLYFVALNKPENKPPTSHSVLPLVSQSDEEHDELLSNKLERQSTNVLVANTISFEAEKPLMRKDSLVKTENPPKLNFVTKPTRPMRLDPNGVQLYWSEYTEEDNPFVNDGVKMKIGEYVPIIKKYMLRYSESNPIYTDREKRKTKQTLIVAKNNKKRYEKGEIVGKELSRKNYPDSYRFYDCFSYTGEPFDDMFEHMVFFSHNRQAQKSPHEINKSTKGENIESTFLVPHAMRFWDIGSRNEDGEFIYNETRLEETCLQPFYFAKSEVNNQDYREFMYWVRNTNGIEDSGTFKYPEDLPENTYLYSFHNLENEYTKSTGKESINIAPNRKVWPDDFSYSYNEPMNDHYLFHPAYKDYPVVGVSYWQALAYLDWLTWIWQSRCDAQNIPYELTCDLPYDYEREYAARRVLYKNGANNYSTDAPTDFLCNLGTSHIKDWELRKQLNLYSPHQFQSEVYTHPTTGQTGTFKNKSSILGLEGNVSEWCKESYTENFEPWRMEYRQKLSEDSTTASELLLSMDEYFHRTCNDKNGKLVRGANWADRRIRPDHINLPDAIWAKAFVDPNEQRSTIGFRFVMRVKLKNEAAIKLKLKTLGRYMPKYDYSSLDKLPTQLWAFPIEISREYLQKEKEKGTHYHIRLNEKKVEWTFSAMITETTNLAWLFFLNYLIDENRIDDLNKCIPTDPDWAYKMSTETEPEINIQDNVEFIDLLPFPESFYKMNNIDLKKFPKTVFAGQPVVNISHEAAQLYCDWLSEIYSHLPDMQEMKFHLPSESEWEVIARNNDTASVYAWSGPYLRNNKGCFLANFNWSQPFDTIASTVKTNQIVSDTVSINRDIKKETDQSDETAKCDISKMGTNWAYQPRLFQCARYVPNNYGLYDICGNAAEMIDEPNKTKGGSFASPGYFLQIKSHEKWNGKPSPRVGFRVFVEKK